MEKVYFNYLLGLFKDISFIYVLGCEDMKLYSLVRKVLFF